MTNSLNASNVFFPVADPGPCYSCLGTCSSRYLWRNQTCDQYSLGTSHCGTAAISYTDYSGRVKRDTFKGCFDCTGKNLLSTLGILI